MNIPQKYWLLAGLFFNLQFVFAQTLDIRIKNIRNHTGQLCIALFANEADFKAEKTCWNAKFDKKQIADGEFTVQIPFKSGCFGLSVLDDENATGKMEYNLLGVPREGFGFSDYYHRGLKRPPFGDFDFYLEKGETKIITVLLKYF